MYGILFAHTILNLHIESFYIKMKMRYAYKHTLFTLFISNSNSSHKTLIVFILIVPILRIVRIKIYFSIK